MKQFAVYVLAIFTCFSCNQMDGSGNIIREKRQTGDFQGISVGGSFKVEVRNGPNTEVEVESDDNIINMIETEVRNGVLRIRTKDGSGFHNAHFKVFITAPEIRTVKSSGASDIEFKDPIKSNSKVSFDVSGAGSIDGMVDAPEVSAEISGAGNIKLSGRTRDYDANVSGSGDLKTADLRSENTEVRVSGAGTARVHASVFLKAHANGAGNVIYNGGARVEQKTSGAGSVKKDD